jgi:hypothetical protein
MMLAAVEAVTKADPVWASRRHNSDVAAQATAGESVHAASPPKSSGRNAYNEQHFHCNCPLRNCPLRAGTRRSSVAGDSDHRFQANRAYQMTLLQHRSVWVVRVAHKASHHKQARTHGFARIEQAVGKLKRFKRVALRCEKTKRNFASIVALTAGFILVKSVHAAKRR